MAIDPEELKRRRAQREQQRKAQQRSMMIKLIFAAAVLIACGVLIFFVTRSQAPGGEDTTGAAVQTPPVTQDTAESTQTAPPATEPTTVIHLAAAGDLNINDAVVASGGSDYDYTQAFLDVAHLLADADICTLNFEGNLCGSPYGSSKSAPQSMMQALANAGVDLIQLANSYSIYKGTSGLVSTIAGVRAAGMEPLGVYASQAEFHAGKGYTICQVQGIKIAFVAFTKGMDGLALPAGSESCVNVLYTDYASTYQTVDTAGISAVLDAAAKENPDITVALLHWGSEFNNTISSTQESICELMLEKGVDAIIGTHPHYVQQMVFDEENGTFVAYSLGDFFSDAQRAGSEYSVLLDLEITRDNNTGVTRITNYSYTPLFTVAEEDSPLRILRIHEAMAAYENSYIDRVCAETYDAMKYALQRIDARIAGE